MGRKKEKKYLIKSQFDLLDDSLKRELMMIPEHDPDDQQLDGLKLTPFMQSLCNKEQINFMQEYMWIIDGEKLKELQRAKIGEGIDSDGHYLRVSDDQKVPLTLTLERKG